MNNLRFALVMAVVFTVPVAQAATEFEDSIPLELAEIFLGLTETDGGVYSDTVDGFPTVDLPATITVLGSLDRQFSQTVYLRTGMDEDAARTLVADLYAQAGWLRLPSPYDAAGPQAVGFTGNMPMIRTFPAMLCHDDLGNLQITANAVSGSTLITLNHSQFMNDPSQNCAQMLQSRQAINQRMTGIRNALQMQLPRLELPEEAIPNGRRAGRAGRISSSGDEVEASTPLETGWSLDEINAYFASQIEGQGWEQDSNWTGNLMAGSNWTRTSEEDQMLVGIFTVVQKQEELYVLNFRMLAR